MWSERSAREPRIRRDTVFAATPRGSADTSMGVAPVELQVTQRKRFLFLSNIAVPPHVKLCESLQRHCDAEFWFYESPDRTRGKWWNIGVGEHSRILERARFAKRGPFREKYWVSRLTAELEEFAPDVLLVGGLSIPANIVAHRWAKRAGIRSFALSERSRNASGKLRRKGIVWRILRGCYRDLDGLMVTSLEAAEQFREEFGFGDIVFVGKYAADLDGLLRLPLKAPSRPLTFLFANRLVDTYNPLGAIRSFALVSLADGGSRLVLNASGPLRTECEQLLAELGLTESVRFLDGLSHWRDLVDVYAESDVLLLPATWSNGNFTIVEAMAAGMGLVISTAILDNGALIRDGENGFRCEPNVEATAERMMRYVREPGLVVEHARMNRDSVRHRTIDATADSWAEMLALGPTT